MFEDLGNKLSNFGNSVKQGAMNFGDSVKQGTSNFTATMNLKNQIENAKREIGETYAALGEKFYMDHQGNAPAGYEEPFGKITSLYQTIENAQQEIRNISGIRVCPQCGQDVQKGFSFCTNCGMRMEPEVKPAEPGKVICQNCGQAVPEGYAFCNFCGTRIVVPAPQPEPQPVPTGFGQPEPQSFEQQAPTGFGQPEPENKMPEIADPEIFLEEEPGAEEAAPAEPEVTEAAAAAAWETAEVLAPEMPAAEEPAPEPEPVPEPAPEPAPAPNPVLACPRCGHKVSPNASFCNMCGHPLK